MLRKMEDVIGALEEEGSAPAPFSEIGSRNGVLRRIRIAERALRLIAGEDPGLLIKEVPTFANPPKKKAPTASESEWGGFVSVGAFCLGLRLRQQDRGGNCAEIQRRAWDCCALRGVERES